MSRRFDLIQRIFMYKYFKGLFTVILAATVLVAYPDDQQQNSSMSVSNEMWAIYKGIAPQWAHKIAGGVALSSTGATGILALAHKGGANNNAAALVTAAATAVVSNLVWYKIWKNTPHKLCDRAYALLAELSKDPLFYVKCTEENKGLVFASVLTHAYSTAKAHEFLVTAKNKITYLLQKLDNAYLYVHARNQIDENELLYRIDTFRKNLRSLEEIINHNLAFIKINQSTTSLYHTEMGLQHQSIMAQAQQSQSDAIHSIKNATWLQTLASVSWKGAKAIATLPWKLVS